MTDCNYVTSTSLRATAVDLGSKYALDAVRAQYASGIKVQTSVASALSAILEARYGFPIISLHHKAPTSDHTIMQLDREVLRSCSSLLLKLDTSALETLLIGCSTEPLRTANGISSTATYYANPANHFYFHSSEGKDASRTIGPFLDQILQRFNNLTSENDSATIKGRKAKRLRMDIQGLEDLFHTWETVTNGDLKTRRLHVARPDKRFYRAVAFDSAYELSESDYFDYFDRHDLTEFYVAGFYPSELLFGDLPEDPSYIYKRVQANTKRLGKDALSTLLSIILRLKFGPAATMITLCSNLLAQVKTGDVKIYDVALTCIYALGDQKTKLVVDAHRLALWFQDYFRTDDRACVTYRAGYSNGYEHPYETWSLLMRKVVLEDPAHDFVIEVECIQTAGTQRLFRLTRSCSTRPVVRTIGLPTGLKPVLLLDVEETFSTAIPQPVYFPVLAREVDETINFLSGQTPGSVTPAMIMTLVFRASKGVKIASTEVSPTWTLPQHQLWKFSLACGFEAQRRANRVESITKEHKAILDGMDTNKWKQFLKTLALGAVTLSTAGAAIPLFVFYQYFTKKLNSVPIVKEVSVESHQRWVPSPDRNLSSVFRFQRDLKLNQAVKEKLSCPTLALMEPFGEQKPRCLHAAGKDFFETEVRVTGEESEALIAKIRKARDEATVGLYAVLDSFKDKIPVHGFNYKAKWRRIIGGPGVGKSYIIRNMITALEKAGTACAVYAPFGKLKADYSETKGFKFYTTHSMKGKHVIAFIDEYTSMPELEAHVTLYLAGVTEVYVVGDELQTGVLPEEGVRFFSNSSKLTLASIPSHILTINFRNDMWSVALANQLFGSGMYAYNDRINIPVVKDIAELPSNPNGAVTMTLTKDAGYTLGFPEENTARSNQGSTHKDVHLIVTSHDLNLLKNDAILLVFITRHKFDGSITIFAEPGPVTTAVRSRLLLDDAEFLANIPKIARPDLDELYGKLVYDDSRAELSALVEALSVNGVISTDEIQQVKETIEANEKPILELVQSSVAARVPNCLDCGDVMPCPCKAMTAEVIQDVLAEISFEEDGWCLPAAATIRPVIDGESCDALPLLEFADYKAFAEERGHKENKGHDVSVLIEFCELKNLKYIVEVLADGTSEVEEFYCNFPRDQALEEPAARVTVRAGHAEVMEPSRIKKYYSTSNFSLHLPDGKERQKIALPCFSTWADVAALRPQLRLKARAIFFKTNPIIDYHHTQLFRFIQGKTTGLKPVWAEKYVKPFHPKPAKYVVGPRSFSLTKEATVAVAPTNAIETEDAEFPRIPAKERLFGTDYYKFASLLDPMVGVAERWCDAAEDLCLVHNLKINLNLHGLLYPKDRKGKPMLLEPPKPAWAISAGFGLVQNNNPTETLACLQRYVKEKPEKPYDPAGAALARRIACLNWEKHYDPSKVFYDQYLESAIASGWASDAVQRSYGAKVEADYRLGVAETDILFSVKEQEKVKPTLKVKAGQGISAASGSVNMAYGSLFRVLNYRKARFLKRNTVYDCGISPASLRSGIREELKHAGVMDDCVILDVVECDANQNWFTMEGEKELNRLVSTEAEMIQIEKYYRDCRGLYKIKSPGLVKANVEGPKPSGLPDTLDGNTTVVENYATALLITQGPNVVCKKGDDRVEWATRITVDRAMERAMKQYTSFEVTMDRGQASFIGLLITPEGAFVDFVKIARKACAHRVPDYKTWCEYQITLRDQLDQINLDGLSNTIGAAAMVYGISYKEAESFYCLLYSLSHIGLKQWQSVASDRSFPVPRQPAVERSPFPSQAHNRMSHDAFVSQARRLTKAELRLYALRRYGSTTLTDRKKF